MPSSYANLLMANLERKLLERVVLKPSVRWRYIDDIFLLWPHGEKCLIEFIDKINNMHSSIKFTAEWSHRSIAFLDVSIVLNEGCVNNGPVHKSYRYSSISSQTKLPSGPLQVCNPL